MENINEITDIVKLIPDIIWYFSSYIMMIYILWKKREWLKIDMKTVNSIVSIMFLLFIGRLMVYSFMGSEVVNLARVDFFDLGIVFLEDAFFVALPLILGRYIKRRWLYIGMWVFFSIWFSYEHRGYPIYWQIFTLFYPYFISRAIVIRSSLSAAMLTHVLYDFSTILTRHYLFWYTMGVIGNG